jgi:hypothetical protein
MDQRVSFGRSEMSLLSLYEACIASLCKEAGTLTDDGIDERRRCGYIHADLSRSVNC